MTQNRFANTIEFNGQKAVINSYSDHPALTESMNRQRTAWACEFPNATVRTESLPEETIIELVSLGNAKTQPGSSYAWDIGTASNAPR